MQYPIHPTLFVDKFSEFRRYLTADSILSPASSIFNSIINFCASFGSEAFSPLYKSGASTTKPFSAYLSATNFICPTKPHHSCKTINPGPCLFFGKDRYPWFFWSPYVIICPFNFTSVFIQLH